MKRALVACVMAVSLTALVPAPASASTCEIGEDNLNQVVCETVVKPATRVACGVVDKLGLGCLA